MQAITENDVFELLPWHREIWSRLNQARLSGRLHHALLISGSPGLGKVQLVRNLAQMLTCDNLGEQGIPCGRCQSCRLVRAGSHPDFLRLEPDPESKSGEIKVDQVRELTRAESLSSHGKTKVILVHPAERMNQNAANGLLKTLEEPTSSTLIVLVSSQPGRLLPTIRSRCQHHSMAVPAEDEALAWMGQQADNNADPLVALRLANGAPLKALEWMDDELSTIRKQALDAFLSLGSGKGDPVAVAAAWMKWDPALLFDWMSGWVADILRLARHDQALRLSNPDRVDALKRLAQRRPQAELHCFWSRIAEAKRGLQGNLTPQLLLESVLIQWNDIGTGT